MQSGPWSLQDGKLGGGRSSSTIRDPKADNTGPESATDQELKETRDDARLDDLKLLKCVTGQIPTSVRLHTTRNVRSAKIMQDLKEADLETENLHARATKYPCDQEYGDSYRKRRLD